jgi:hypothetical protein
MRTAISVLTTLLCVAAVFVLPSKAQVPGVEPLHVPAGTVLTFHLQSRLNPTEANELDSLPKGTTLQVRILEAIDSDVNKDGSEFHGVVVSALVSGSDVVVHSDAEVHGLLALLRTASHPKGFRYELLVTGLTDHGKNIPLTASLNRSFVDASSRNDAPEKSGAKEAPLPIEPERIAVHR